MKKWVQELGRYVLLTVITVLAVGVMIWVSMRDDSAAERAREQVTAEAPIVSRTKPLVAVEEVEAAVHEVTAKFSGKIRPWETYSIGFEIGGRLIELGVDKSGRPLDDGSRVEAGQLLARLDERILLARRNEASARLEQTSADLRRARQVRDQRIGAITESEFQETLTQHALAQAQLEIATKNLEDAALTAPVAGTLVRRLAVPGESISPHQVVFELVENQQMLLVVDVPESQFPELERRMRVVQQLPASADQGDPESRVFRARVDLESRDRFGNPLPPLEGEVFRIAERADARTGLFEVEIRLPNEDRLLRAGMVATAEVVVDRISAYRVPETAVLFRGDQTYVFGLAQQPEPLKVMFWDLQQVPVDMAVQVPLPVWIDQGDHLLVPTTSVALDRVVVRGQQRLSDGQHVRVVNEGELAKPGFIVPAAIQNDPSVARQGTNAPVQ